jgi:DNA-binding transcriptional regulator YhcF (GntR family)
MTNLYNEQFVKQAMASGVPQENIAAILKRAQQISQRLTKVAFAKANPRFDIVDSLLKSAGMEKTASSVGYAQGILNEAFMNGANLNQAVQFTKQALDSSVQRMQFMQKVAAITNNPKLNQYAEGFVIRAKEAGMSQDDAVALLVDVVDREKLADAGGMFKQPSDGPQAPPSDPAAGAPPSGPMPGGDPTGAGDPTGGADPEAAQIMQMLQSLPPEEQQAIISQLLQAISGGQGGPGGPAGGPPGAGSPPPSAMGPGGPGGAPQGPM